ncbi:GNAT family N-acetyltransferase [Streptomyces sp. NPDC058008]|uniref:GNAT family N-acetyltransferase n=1 Tax=Streptomyces sp. NPDC058008 TaxID=3346303 RepID=UPI0036EEFE98
MTLDADALAPGTGPAATPAPYGGVAAVPRGRTGTSPEPAGAHPGTAVRWSAVDWEHPDARALRARMDAELRPRYAPFDAQRAGRQADPPTASEIVATWLAHEGAHPVAMASLRRLRGPDGGGLHEVKRVYVHDGYRGRGLARAALDAVGTSARALGVTRLALQTGKLQPEAMALYERQGWQRIPCYPPYDTDPFSVCYAKDL